MDSSIFRHPRDQSQPKTNNLQCNSEGAGQFNLSEEETPTSVTKHLNHPRGMAKLLYKVTCLDDMVTKEEVIDGD